MSIHSSFPCFYELHNNLNANPDLAEVVHMEPSLVTKVAEYFQNRELNEASLSSEVGHLIVSHNCDWFWGCKGWHGVNNWNVNSIQNAFEIALKKTAKQHS